MPRPRLILGLALAAFALVPSAAQAATWCAGSVPGATCDQQYAFTSAGLSQALADAGGASGAQTVRVGSGTLTLSFNPVVGAGITLRGAGRTATTLVLPGTNGSLDVSGTGAALRDLTVRTTGLTSATDIIDVSQQGTVTGVGVIEASTAPNNQTVHAITARSGSGAIVDIDIDLNSANDAGIEIRDSTLTVSDVRIDGPARTGIEILAAGQIITIDRARITGTERGVIVQNALNTIVRDSLIDLGTTTAARGIGVGFLALSADASVDVIRTLVVGEGPQQKGLFIDPNATSWDVLLRANGSVVDLTGGQATDLACSGANGSGTSSITATALAFRSQAQTDCGAADTSAIDLAAEPLRYRDAAARDFRPVSPSPVIDRGTSLAPAQSVDLAGQPRFVDGAPGGGAALDLGPYEYQRRSPTTPETASIPSTATVGQTVALSASGGSDPDGDYTEYGWTFGDGSLGVGPAVTHTFTKPGTYVVGVVLRDAAGLESPAVSSTVVVTAPGEPQSAGGTPTSTPTPVPVPSTASTGPGTSQALPTLTLLAGRARTVRRSNAGFTTSSDRAGAVAAITTSSAGTLRLTLTRLSSGRRAGQRCSTSARRGARCTLRKTVKGAATVAVPAGTTGLRFGGTFAGRRLPAGRYAATATLRSEAGTSRPVTFTFTLR